MNRTTLTKTEIRQVWNNDPVFKWWRDTINEHFGYEKNLIGAPDSERLFTIKGHAEVLRFMNDIDRLLELLDIEEE